MPREKQLLSPEEYKKLFKQYNLTIQIEIYQWIKEFLEYTKKEAQNVQNQLNEVVKEKQ